MTDFLREVWRFFWRRTSERMCCLMISGAEWLSDDDLRQMEDYFEALREYRAISLRDAYPRCESCGGECVYDRGEFPPDTAGF